MKPLMTIIFSILGLITLLSLQLCLLAYEQHTQFNLLVIAYVYILLTNCSLTALTILAIMMDALTYISTGLVGLTIIFLVPASWITLKIQKSMYNKIIIPCSLLVLYAIFYNVTLYISLSYPVHIGEMMWAILQNCICLISVWWFTNQPIHD